MNQTAGKTGSSLNTIVAWGLIIGLIGLGLWLQYQEQRAGKSGDQPAVAEQDTAKDPSDELAPTIKPIAPSGTDEQPSRTKSKAASEKQVAPKTTTDDSSADEPQSKAAKSSSTAKTVPPTKPTSGKPPEPKSSAKESGFTNPADPKAVTKSSNPANTRPVNPRAPPGSAAPKKGVFSNVTIRDQDGDVIYQGEIDLTKTLQRIDSGERISRFPNDGSVFQNREGRLPRQPPGYYHEWVHPTPDERGPGPQRVVTGDDGDVWYTHDHYRTFRRVPR
ncbi:MAG: hypothetical protein JNM18_00085 [Planctomycetaceae bacterium]|nr:hypothetical protein [Planctomycetaceae bacterium]